jgi:hypothetical protein
MATASTNLDAELVSEAIPEHLSSTQTAADPDGHMISLPYSSNDSSGLSHADGIVLLPLSSEETSDPVRNSDIHKSPHCKYSVAADRKNRYQIPTGHVC